MKKVRENEESLKMLDLIEGKEKNNESFTDEELRFLYEIDGYINFDYHKRVQLLLEKRDRKNDLARIFNCSEDMISLDRDNVLENQIYYSRDTFICNLDNLSIPPSGIPYLYLNKLKNATGLVIPDGVKEVYLDGLESADGLVLPDSVKLVSLNGLKSAKNLKLPNGVRDVFLDGLESADDLVLPDSVELVSLNGLKSAKELDLPRNVEVVLLGSLEDTAGLVIPESVNSLLFGDLSKVDKYDVPEDIVFINLNNIFLFEKLKFISDFVTIHYNGKSSEWEKIFSGGTTESSGDLKRFFTIDSDEDLMLLRIFLCRIESGRIEEYNKEIKDFCMLHDIIILQKNDGTLSDEGLRFLYEMESSIYKNSKIMNTMYERIITKRNRKEDLAKLFNCSEDMISLDKDNVFDNQIYYDGYTFVYNGNKDIVIPKATKELYLNGVEDIKGIVIPEGVLVVWYKEKKYSREEFLDLQKKSMYKFSGTPKIEYFDPDGSPAKGDGVAKVLKPNGFVTNTIILTNIILFGILSFIITLMILK